VKSALGFDIGTAFCSDQARELLANMIADPSIQNDFKQIHLQLCAVVRVLGSQRRKINIAQYNDLCSTVTLKICDTFPWAAISPSLHRVLAHSAELFELNNDCGLGSGSEEGLESQNKYVRHLRLHGARSTSIEDNFEDTFKHLWKRSSPLIAALDRERKQHVSKIIVQTEIDSLVESLFCEENYE
jgi:hypothetical protein